MAGKFENTKPPKPKVPGAPRGTGAAALPESETGNRAQRRAAARKKKAGPGSAGAAKKHP